MRKIDSSKGLWMRSLAIKGYYIVNETFRKSPKPNEKKRLIQRTFWWMRSVIKKQLDLMM
jgi:hypothetical protein